MKALAVVQVVFSIVELVDLGRNCLRKDLRIYRSNNGVLDDNIAVGATAVQLSALDDEVNTIAVSIASQALNDLCDQILKAASGSLAALEKL